MKYATALLLLAVLLLAACGQKGPLFLPGNAPAQQDATTTQSEQEAPVSRNDEAEQP